MTEDVPTMRWTMAVLAREGRRGKAERKTGKNKTEPTQRMLTAGGDMFDAASRVVLQERLGYERYVLNKCGSMVQAAYGSVSGVEMTVNDQPEHAINIAIEDHIGAGHALSVVQDASPLLFSAAFKLLDMVMEWTIFENRGTCPWKFHQKRAIINATPSAITYPDYLQADAHLRGVVIALYHLAEHRNAITHGDWGENHDGELRFDYVVQFTGAHVQVNVPFQSVLDFAAFAAMVGDTLVDPALQTPFRVSTLRWLTDRIQALHGGPVVNALLPQFVKVRRVTTWQASTPVEIDLAGIRKFIAEAKPGVDTFFDLAVDATTPAGKIDWSIPSEAIPPGDNLVLDHNWDQYHAPAPQAPTATPLSANAPSQPNPHWAGTVPDRWPLIALAAFVGGCLFGYLVSTAGR